MASDPGADGRTGPIRTLAEGTRRQRGAGQVIAYTRAVAGLDPTDIDDLYWAGRITLVNRQADLAIYNTAFEAFFMGSEGDSPPPLLPVAAANGDHDDAAAVSFGTDRQEIGLLDVGDEELPSAGGPGLRAPRYCGRRTSTGGPRRSSTNWPACSPVCAYRRNAAAGPVPHREDRGSTCDAASATPSATEVTWSISVGGSGCCDRDRSSDRRCFRNPWPASRAPWSCSPTDEPSLPASGGLLLRYQAHPLDKRDAGPGSQPGLEEATETGGRLGRGHQDR